MATREQSSPSARVPNRTGKRRSQTNQRLGRIAKPDVIGGLIAAESIEKAIEAERDKLSRAESLLGCLAIAMEHGEWQHEDEVMPPYYPDVARMARTLVRQSINALDSLYLNRHVVKRMIKEPAEIYGGAPEPAGTFTPRWPLMRVLCDSLYWDRGRI